MTDKKIRNANGHKIEQPAPLPVGEVEATAELGIHTATDGDGLIVVRFTEAISLMRLERLAVARFIAALAKEAKIEVELKL